MNFLTAVKKHRERQSSVGLRVTESEIGRVASDARRGEDLITKAVQKITLFPSRDIPFDKLMLSQANVRPVMDDDGNETGKFEIPAGGRRFQALSLLVKRKRLAKTTPIGVLEAGMGLKVIEIHAAHGYLLSSFLSALANRRTDRYGGSLENRHRLPMEIYAAVRAVCPKDEAVALAEALNAAGANFVDVSSGGNAPAEIPVGPGYQLPFASRIRREVGITTITVGMIRSPLHAESIVTYGEADMVALGRGFLNDPRWPWHAAETLGHKLNVVPQYQLGATSQYHSTVGR